MNKEISIKTFLWKFGCRRAPTLNTITTDLGVNTKDSIITMDKPVIKDIKKRMEDLVIFNSAAATKVDCGLHTMQAINFLSIVVQCLANRGLPPDISVLQEIDAECAKSHFIF